jgi:hypothetical protein
MSTHGARRLDEHHCDNTHEPSNKSPVAALAQNRRVTRQTVYVRYQARDADDRGRFLGIFALVNTLAKQERLTVEQERFRRTNNDWYDAAYTDPATVDPTVYDWTTNPGAAALFKPNALHLVARIDGYLSILTEHGIRWERLEAPTPPGRVVYEDEHQVVVVPQSAAVAASPVVESRGHHDDRSLWTPRGAQP